MSKSKSNVNLKILLFCYKYTSHMQGNFVQILLLGVGNSSMIPLYLKFSTTMKQTCLKHLNTLFKKKTTTTTGFSVPQPPANLITSCEANICTCQKFESVPFIKIGVKRWNSCSSHTISLFILHYNASSWPRGRVANCQQNWLWQFLSELNWLACSSAY